ncbi:hypothetical protein ABIC28_005141 [Rhodococcus sp. PvR044]|uniref:cutinase family protein n=1 Tax=Rhodococcus sp. PvR044 TaxID=3156402 RepID=UPI00339A1FEE
MPARRSRARRAVALIVTATVAGAGVALTAPAIANADPARCAATFNLFIPGTWETNANADPNQTIGMLKPIGDAIKRENGSQADVYTLPYMARAFDNGHTYADSKADGLGKAEQVLEQIAEACRNTKITITGYSQGADIAGDLASGIGNEEVDVPAERVLAVGLLADPGTGTKGSATVGPRTAGTGIADPRPQGMGKLSGRVATICDPGDMYCSIKKGSNPLLGSLGSILSKTPSGTANSGTADSTTQVATALTSDFSDADLPELGSDVATLGKQLSEPTVDIGQIATTATSIAKTLTPLADLLDSGAANSAATSQLAAAPAGTAENGASQVLTRAGQSDLAGALSTVTTIADTATKLTSGGSTRLPSNSPDITSLSTAAGTLGGQVAPVASTPADALSTATNVLGVLKPKVVVDQILNVSTNITALDFPAILRNLELLVQRVAAGDARGAHEVSGQLNNQFSPLVKMTAAVDLKWASQVLSIIPDPSGYTQIAALVTSILGNVDIVKLANLIGQVQEIAWAAVEKLFPPPGQIPDLLGAGAAMTGLLPVGLDLASVAANMLSGKASKTSPELLGKQSSKVATSITAQAQTLDLPALTGSLTTMAQSQGAEDLVGLVKEGLTAATFYSSGAHTNYNALVVDNAGRNAVQWLTDWLNLQIGRAA